MRIDVAQLTTFYHPLMIQLLVWLEDETGFEFTITSLHRPGDSGVHGTMKLRATDLRCRSHFIGFVVEGMINRAWTYDPARPEMQCCIFHDAGNGEHLHLQVHPNTLQGAGS